MKFEFCAGGANVPVIRDFEVNKTAEIYEGQVVCLTDGVIDEAVEDGIVIGVAAETHTGKEDVLNARANGNKIRVNISPDAVYSAKAKTLTANSANGATLIKCTTSEFSSSVTGGALVLVEKAENSTNTDKVGAERKVTAVAVSGGVATFTVSDGGVACEGDVYAYYPEMGGVMTLDNTKCGFAPVNADCDVEIKAVGRNTQTGEVYFKLENSLFA